MSPWIALLNIPGERLLIALHRKDSVFQQQRRHVQCFASTNVIRSAARARPGPFTISD